MNRPVHSKKKQLSLMKLTRNDMYTQKIQIKFKRKKFKE